MEMGSYTITLAPDGQSCQVAEGIALQQALGHLGVEITAPCGGEGTCGKCRVQVLDGKVDPVHPEERALLTEEELAAGTRLACRARVQGSVEISVPASTRTSAIRVLPSGSRRQIDLAPAVTKQAVVLEKQALEGAHSRLEHLRQCGGLRADLRAGIDLLRQLPDLIPYEAEQVTAVLRDAELLAVEEGDTADRCLGLALDLGTTTVVANLVDLGSGKILGSGVAGNRQATEGHDVIARVNFTVEHQDGLETMRRAALDSLTDAIVQVLERAGASRRDVYEATLVGNATMMHLVLGVSPASLGRLPFAAVVGDAVDLQARQLGLDLHPAARVHVLPNIAGFVGADTVGAMLAASFDEDDGRARVLVDIGTNCELALRRGDRLIVASTPAGPAFEGARISCGMYAVSGAIESFRILDAGADGACTDGQVELKVIGNAEPRGLCGSAVVDVAAELLRTGIVDETGRILGDDELSSDLPPALRERVVEREGELTFVVAETAGHAPVALTQRDIRELQLAKAAIRSGIDLLLERGGVGLDEVEEFCIAGGFGRYLDRGNAIGLGLIPPFPLEKLRYIGNGALMGALLALLSTGLRRRGQHLAGQAEHLQIAGTPDFQMRFSEAMLFESARPDASRQQP